MQSLTPGMELLGATPGEKTSSMEITKIKRSLWGKTENVLGTRCQIMEHEHIMAA